MKLFGKRRIYLDYASAPPVLPEAVRTMRETEELVGNPGAIHTEGVEAKKSLNGSRARIAALLGCKARELVFTSGLTEANDLAIVGRARHLEFLRSDLKGPQGRTLEGTHWIVSSIEHDSVLECFSEVERLGGTITYVDSNEGGIITPESVVRALRPETVFVSVGWANNELGTIQPLAKIARCIREHEEKHKTTVVLHADAGQAPLYLPTLVTSLHVDLLSIGANKLYGPHGVGTLYISDRTQLAPIVLGGKQERGLRGGTESVALAAGFATSYEIVAQEREAESARLQKLRDELVRELTTRIPKLVVNGDLRRTLPHMLNISIPDVQSEYIVLALDHAGIAISTKSACREGEERVSHVVAVLGGEAWRAKNTFRFSLGRDTTKRGIRKAAETLILILNNTPS